MNVLQKISFVSLSLVLAACSTSQVGGIDYKSSRRGNALEIPPDLTRTTGSDRYNVPSSTSALAYAGEQKKEGQASTTALSAVGDVQIKRDGNQRWLVVARTPQQLWEPVKSFWEDNGFALTVEDRKVGVMETDWAENRANIPLDPIRAALGRALDSLYSTSMLDKFRTRLEANASGGTDIFISQRGMEEVYSGRDKESTTWQQRPNDPGLEDEFLRRMMIALGVSKERADSMLKQSQQTGQAIAEQAKASVKHDEAAGTLALVEDFDRAWRRVGLSLDRTGFTVEDRDRAKGIYYVRYVPFAGQKKESKGWFSNLFSKAPVVNPVRYLVQVQAQGSGSNVRVMTEGGQAASAADSSSILKVLAEDLRRM